MDFIMNASGLDITVPDLWLCIEGIITVQSELFPHIIMYHHVVEIS